MRRLMLVLLILSAFSIALAPQPIHMLFLPLVDRHCPAPPWPNMITGENCQRFYAPPYTTPIPYCRTGYTVQLDLICYGYVQPPNVTYVFPSPLPGGWPTQSPP